MTKDELYKRFYDDFMELENNHSLEDSFILIVAPYLPDVILSQDEMEFEKYIESYDPYTPLSSLRDHMKAAWMAARDK